MTIVLYNCFFNTYFMIKVIDLKNIQLRIIGTGYNNYYQAIVNIYDKNNHLICSKMTYNGVLNVCLKTSTCYFLIIKWGCSTLKKVIYIGAKPLRYTIVLNHAIIKQNHITFVLTDQFYDNLPIKKGKVILWQKQ